MSPLGSDGIFHESVSCNTSGVVDRPEIGPGTVQDYTIMVT